MEIVKRLDRQKLPVLSHHQPLATKGTMSPTFPADWLILNYKLMNFTAFKEQVWASPDPAHSSSDIVGSTLLWDAVVYCTASTYQLVDFALHNTQIALII